jgi:hypothetical protein
MAYMVSKGSSPKRFFFFFFLLEWLVYSQRTKPGAGCSERQKIFRMFTEDGT